MFFYVLTLLRSDHFFLKFANFAPNSHHIVFMEEFLFIMAIHLIYWRQVSYNFTVIKSSESVTIFKIEYVLALTHGSILVLLKFFFNVSKSYNGLRGLEG